MAHKRIGGWLIKHKLFAQIRVANELWYFGRRDGSNEKQVSLFFVGWYEIAEPEYKEKLLTLTILWLNIQVGVAI